MGVNGDDVTNRRTKFFPVLDHLSFFAQRKGDPLRKLAAEDLDFLSLEFDAENMPCS